MSWFGSRKREENARKHKVMGFSIWCRLTQLEHVQKRSAYIRWRHHTVQKVLNTFPVELEKLSHELEQANKDNHNLLNYLNHLSDMEIKLQHIRDAESSAYDRASEAAKAARHAHAAAFRTATQNRLLKRRLTAFKEGSPETEALRATTVGNAILRRFYYRLKRAGAYACFHTWSKHARALRLVEVNLKRKLALQKMWSGETSLSGASAELRGLVHDFAGFDGESKEMPQVDDDNLPKGRQRRLSSLEVDFIGRVMGVAESISVLEAEREEAQPGLKSAAIATFSSIDEEEQEGGPEENDNYRLNRLWALGDAWVSSAATRLESVESGEDMEAIEVTLNDFQRKIIQWQQEIHDMRSLHGLEIDANLSSEIEAGMLQGSTKLQNAQEQVAELSAELADMMMAKKEDDAVAKLDSHLESVLSSLSNDFIRAPERYDQLEETLKGVSKELKNLNDARSVGIASKMPPSKLKTAFNREMRRRQEAEWNCCQKDSEILRLRSEDAKIDQILHGVETLRELEERATRRMSAMSVAVSPLHTEAVGVQLKQISREVEKLVNLREESDSVAQVVVNEQSLQHMMKSLVEAAQNPGQSFGHRSQEIVEMIRQSKLRQDSIAQCLGNLSLIRSENSGIRDVQTALEKVRMNPNGKRLGDKLDAVEDRVNELIQQRKKNQITDLSNSRTSTFDNVLKWLQQVDKQEDGISSLELASQLEKLEQQTAILTLSMEEESSLSGVLTRLTASGHSEAEGFVATTEAIARLQGSRHQMLSQIVIRQREDGLLGEVLQSTQLSHIPEVNRLAHRMSWTMYLRRREISLLTGIRESHSLERLEAELRNSFNSETISAESVTNLNSQLASLVRQRRKAQYPIIWRADLPRIKTAIEDFEKWANASPSPQARVLVETLKEHIFDSVNEYGVELLEDVRRSVSSQQQQQLPQQQQQHDQGEEGPSGSAPEAIELMIYNLDKLCETQRLLMGSRIATSAADSIGPLRSPPPAITIQPGSPPDQTPNSVLSATHSVGIGDLQRELEKVEGELQSVTAVLSEKENVIEELRGKMDRKETEIVEISRRLQEQEARVASAEAEMAKEREESKVNEERVKELEKEVDEACDELSVMRGETESLKTEMTKVQEELDRIPALQEEKTLLEQRLEKMVSVELPMVKGKAGNVSSHLTGVLESLRDAAELSKNLEVATPAVSHDYMERRMDVLEAELTRVIESISNMEDDHTDVQVDQLAQVSDLKEVLDATKERLRKSEEMSAAMSSEMGSLKVQNGALETENVSLRKKVVTLSAPYEDEIAELKAQIVKEAEVREENEKKLHSQQEARKSLETLLAKRVHELQALESEKAISEATMREEFNRKLHQKEEEVASKEHQLVEECTRKIATSEASHDHQVLDLKKEHRLSVAKLEEEWDKKLKAMREEARTSIDTLQLESDKIILQLRRDNADLGEKNIELTNTISTLRDDIQSAADKVQRLEKSIDSKSKEAHQLASQLAQEQVEAKKEIMARKIAEKIATKNQHLATVAERNLERLLQEVNSLQEMGSNSSLTSYQRAADIAIAMERDVVKLFDPSLRNKGAAVAPKQDTFMERSLVRDRQALMVLSSRYADVSGKLRKSLRHIRSGSVKAIEEVQDLVTSHDKSCGIDAAFLRDTVAKFEASRNDALSATAGILDGTDEEDEPKDVDVREQARGGEDKKDKTRERDNKKVTDKENPEKGESVVDSFPHRSSHSPPTKTGYDRLQEEIISDSDVLGPDDSLQDILNHPTSKGRSTYVEPLSDADANGYCVMLERLRSSVRYEVEKAESREGWASGTKLEAFQNTILSTDEVGSEVANNPHHRLQVEVLATQSTLTKLLSVLHRLQMSKDLLQQKYFELESTIGRRRAVHSSDIDELEQTIQLLRDRLGMASSAITRCIACKDSWAVSRRHDYNCEYCCGVFCESCARNKLTCAR